MSNKYFRRVEANLQNQILLKKTDEENDEEETVQITKRINKFAFLNENEETNSSGNNSDSDQNIKSIELCNKNVKKSKKKKKKEKSEKSSNNNIDVFLNLKDKLESPVVNSILIERQTLMRIDVRNLSADNELRKLLGKSFGRSIDATQQGDFINNRSYRTVRSRLVKLGLNWPPLTKIGISMTNINEKNGIKWFKFEHNQDYKELQQLFWFYQNQLDYEGIMNDVMVKNPYHLDSLLILAEYLRVHEDAQSSRDTLERGLFACENVLHSNFQLFSLDSRLSYEWRENRAFFLLAHYYILSLIQRNCFGTALEYTKLIFIKDPDYDPLSVLLIIDSLALKAKKYQFLIDFYNNYKVEKKLDLLPNFVYSVALAHYFLSSLSINNSSINKIEAEKCLEYAISCFPFLLGQILDKLQIKADSSVENCYPLSTLAFYKETNGLRLLTEIYLHHSHELWKLPNVLLWLETTTHKILPKISNSLKTKINEWNEKRKRIFVGIPDNIKRHLIIHSIKQEVVDSNSTLVDPCPPSRTLSDYFPIDSQGTSFGTTSRRFNLEGLSSNTLLELARTLLPDDFQPYFGSAGANLRNYTNDVATRIFNQLNFLDNSENVLTNEENANVELNVDVKSTEIENSSTNELNNQTINEESPSSSNNLLSSETSLADDNLEKQ